MSGLEQVENRRQLRESLFKLKPDLAQDLHIMNDSVGSVYTASAQGGMVIISGTGSIAQFIAADGTAWRTGGWGHMIGDEGSAYDIASTAISRIFHCLDGFSLEASGELPDASQAVQAMKAYFAIEEPSQLLEHFYTSFQKAKVAGFATEVAKLAKAGDPMCAGIFHEVGRKLGALARTLAPQVMASHLSASQSEPKLAASVPEAERGLGATLSAPQVSIVCEGSVWKSWPLLQGGFQETVFEPARAASDMFHRQAAKLAPSEQHTDKRQHRLPPGSVVQLSRVILLRLEETSAIGAAWLAASLSAKGGVCFPLDREPLVVKLADLHRDSTAIEEAPHDRAL